MPKYLWKFLKSDLKSAHGSLKWKVGEWKKIEGQVTLCENGFHASKKILDALSYVRGEVLAYVEVKGKHKSEEDKQAWSEMRIEKAYHWTNEDSISLAIYAAELCLANFEKTRPDDKRPRDAIEAAKAYLKNPCEKTRIAASAAWSAASAASEVSAAWSAASAARSAADAAWSAASAAGAARSAASAAWSAVGAAIKGTNTKIENWLQNHVKKLKPYKRRTTNENMSRRLLRN